MKKQILGFVLCFLLMGSSSLAADGDLIVNGKVGIGTATPSHALEVNGLLKMQSNNQILLRDDTAGIYSSNTNEISFFTNAGNKMTINSSGYVGVGTTNPKGPLDITGSIPRLYVVKSDASANRGIWRFNGDTDGVLSLQSINDAQNSAYNAFTITRDSTNGIASVLFPNGFVGIGTTSLETGYTLTVYGSGFARQGIWQESDIGRKENIGPIDSPLDKILNLEGIGFTWKKEEDTEGGQKEKVPEGRQFGVIAQDVEKVLPEVVRTGMQDEKAVNYAQIIPVLIEAMKAQQRQIDTLKAEIAGLKENR